MKKILTLLLALSMIIAIASLSSCEIIEQYVPGLDLGVNTDGEGNEETDNKTDAPEIRTTVTKDEWLGAMNCTNFSYEAHNYNKEGKPQMSYKQQYSQTAMYMYSLVAIPGAEDESAQYSAIIDGIGYNITKDENGFVGVNLGATDAVIEIPLSKVMVPDVCESWETLFDSLTYNEETKTYTGNCTYSGNEATLEASFADGKVVKLEFKFVKLGSNCIATYYDFGTTVVEIPEFTVAE